jgi:hypothetical protein
VSKATPPPAGPDPKAPPAAPTLLKVVITGSGPGVRSRALARLLLTRALADGDRGDMTLPPDLAAKQAAAPPPAPPRPAKKPRA